MLNSTGIEEEAAASSSAPLDASPKPFALQAGGHQHRNGDESSGLLELADHSVLKPLALEGRGLRELRFYEAVFSPSCEDEILLRLRPMISRFMGTVQLFRGCKMVTFLKLENLTAGYEFPCVMDVKIGVVTSDPEASPTKVQREKEKYKHTKILGFCIPGMMVYDIKSGQYTAFNKEDGKKLTESTVKAAFVRYLGGMEGLDISLVEGFCQQLHSVRDWFLIQRQWAFYSSSLLFVYDAAPLERTLSHRDDCCQRRCCDVRMIDFAHVFPENGINSNYMFGLNHVIGIFEEIRHDLTKLESST